MSRIFKKDLIIIIFVLFFFSTTTSIIHAANTWINTTSLPYNLASHVAVSHLNKIFVVGGSAVTAQSKYDVLASNTTNNGTLTSWDNLSLLLPTALIFHAGTVKDNYLYIVGGFEENPGSSNDHVNKVFKGNIINGSVNTWEPLNPLPKKLSMANLVTIGNRLYVAGGTNQQGISNNIYFTEINPDGTIGAWNSAGNLPEPLFGFGMHEINGKIVIVGGNNGSGAVASVRAATLNPDGTIQGWTNLPSLPQPMFRGGTAISKNFLVVVGGINNNGYLSSVYFTPIDDQGNLGAWETSDAEFPRTNCCSPIVSANEYIYQIGGHNGGYYSDVHMISIYDLTGTEPPNTTLNIPFFSQNILPWGPTEYDHAVSLGFDNTTMERWGCAVTSAAMVLQYHGMTQMTDNSTLDPGTLNSWLKDNNGYATGTTSEGSYSYLSWPAISKLSKDLYDAGKSTTKLEHQRAYPSIETTTLLHEDLTIRNMPDILYVNNASTSGHFVVAKGIQDTTYAINDPEWNVPTLTSFNNQYTQIDRYIPSLTDLSYILITVNPSVHVLVTDSQGRKAGKMIINGVTQAFSEIPTALYAFENPISNPTIVQTLEQFGTGVNVFLLPKPENDTFTLKFSAGKEMDYVANVAVYQPDGTNALYKFTGFVGKNYPDSLILPYSPTSPNPTSPTKSVTFDTLIQDIKEGNQMNQISDALAKVLLVKAENAKRDYQSNKEKQVIIMLRQMIKNIEDERPKYIKPQAQEILSYDIQTLLSSL